MLPYLIENIFLRIAACAADAAADNPNGIKTPLTNGLRTFSMKKNLVFGNGRKSLPRSPPDCPTLCNWDFDNFTLV